MGLLLHSTVSRLLFSAFLAGLLADHHDDTEPTLDAGDELLPGDPFSLPDNPASQDGQDDDDDDDDTMPTDNMSSLEKSLQVGVTS